MPPTCLDRYYGRLQDDGIITRTQMYKCS